MDIFVSTKSVFLIRFRVGGCRPAASPVGVSLQSVITACQD